MKFATYPIALSLLGAILLALVFATPTHGQFSPEDLKKLTGLAPMSAADYLKFQQVKMVREFTTLSGKPNQNLPASVDLSPEFPPVGKQDDPSCAAFTFAYAIKSYQEHIENGWGYGPNHIFSPTFMYNRLNPDHTIEKLPETDVLNFILNVGAVPLSLSPYAPGDMTQPTQEVIAFAKAFRTFGFRRIATGDINTLKSVLAGGDPVALAISVNQDFLHLSKSNPIFSKFNKNQIVSAHYLVVVGYDDAKHAIKVYNSWGKTWGDNGMAWIDYDLFNNNDFIGTALVTYDRPTPLEVVAYLKDANSKLGDLPKFVMAETELHTALKGYFDTSTLKKMIEPISMPAALSAAQKGDWQSAPLGDPLTVFPEEAGMTKDGAWLRLGEPLTHQQDFFSENVSPRFKGFNLKGDEITVLQSFLNAEVIGRIDMIKGERVHVLTNRGIGFGDTRVRVHQVYREPDDATPDHKRETYFFKAAAQDWGGVAVINHSALEFHYSNQGNVEMISLFTAFKDAYTGKSLKPIDDKEVSSDDRGKMITSPEGHVSFVVPEAFSRADKSVWPGVGVGYFIKEHVLNPTWMITVKVFDVAGANKEKLVSERIPADLKTYAMLNLKEQLPVHANDVEWLVYSDASRAFVNFYTARNGRFYQVNVATDMPVTDEAWFRGFLESFKFVP